MPEEFPWVSYRVAHSFEKAAEEQGVSEVARSHRGFMRQYEAAGSAQVMRKMKVAPIRSSEMRTMKKAGSPSQTWGQRRTGFIKRHLAEYVKHKTYRRWLALMMWAYRAGEPPAPSS